MLIALIACSAWIPAFAGTPDAKAKAEIDKLMASLDDTCRFQRNGTWYNAAQARDHLQTKYDWLLKRGMVDSAEQFVDRAASKSSMSGKPYRVACSGGTEQDAGPWFLARLQRLREAARTPSKP